ncbi:MbcA/ParS/Xre antitoxin family protein [Loktanella sp. TSTF-M6]|uniref:MbcA/ParS/Xre antitoxin family protein n=1 Tax=Loktanella gaetbuli TaxID=2881335 RepID=A0ABS8BXQ5_9RHOB|nr:MbcA/ParS/Xre antitoxin family protein [Loktanella gaetbuli]MCB5200508.1 MbcA/ParS/Xre antitoxin family protein [Loktanella gaetbuli]
MLIANFANTGASSGTMEFHSISREDRVRTSAPGLRTFREIADRFGLTEAERIAVLGDPGRSTYHQWMKKAREHQPLTLPLDTLLRISAILGIYKALTILFEDENQALVWLKGPHQGTLFAGASPMAYMLEGGHDGLMSVRRYLDAWRGGEMGYGAPEGSFEPVTEDDLVFA